MNAVQDKAILAAAGWQSAEEGPSPTPFDRFSDRLVFSLQRELFIEPPSGSVGIDLSRPSAGTEYELRRAFNDLFLEHFASETCYAIDVNHGEWTFVPQDLRVTHHYEPFPVSVTPWAEYVVFGNGDFSHGVFGNPHNEHLVVFGGIFVARFSSLHEIRIVPARLAAGRRTAPNP